MMLIQYLINIMCNLKLNDIKTHLPDQKYFHHLCRSAHHYPHELQCTLRTHPYHHRPKESKKLLNNYVGSQN